jgi:hypothetical protein
LRITHPEEIEQIIFRSLVTAADYWQALGSPGGQFGIGIALVLERLAGAMAVALDEDALA